MASSDNTADTIMKLKQILVASIAFILMACNSSDKNEVNVYTHRYYDADKELFKKFEEITGIKVNVKKDNADKLINLLKTEGKNTQADLLVTVDAGRLYYAKKLNVLQSVSSPILSSNIPAPLRDAQNFWIGLTKRARVFVYNPDVTTIDPNLDYKDLVKEEWKSGIVVRSSSNIYNQSLMASQIAHYGEKEALAWAKGVVANMYREPKGNDRDQIKQVAMGNGKIAIANTYYIGKLLNSENELERDAGQKVKVFFPGQNAKGTHINVSGAGVTRYAPNKENAIKLLEFLSSEEAQKVFASSNYEYPVHPKVQPDSLLNSWGTFKEDDLDIEDLGMYNAKAVELFSKAKWK